MRSCQINVKILTGNSSSLLFKLPCQQPTFQCPDFEDAVLRAVTAVFGRHINHQGCFYHLTQASWRQIQQLGLVPLYKNDDDFRVFCGMMDGLAFLPVPDLTNGIHLLRTLCPDDPPEAAELLDYFDSTYISGRLRQQNPAQNRAVRLVLRRSPPMFPPAIWNVHDARTNNMCEGWNNKFFNLVGHAHPSIWRVIEWCQKEEATVCTITSKMPSVIHQLSVLNRDMFSSRSVYRTYAETSLLARRPLPSSCVERMEHQTQSPDYCLRDN